MTLPPNAQNWIKKAEMDYIGPFTKAWAAFNAWYRHASGEEREFLMLKFVKEQPNALRRSIIPSLQNQTSTAQVGALMHAISDLQRVLDEIHLETKRKGVNERITMRSVCIEPKEFQNEKKEHRGHILEVSRIQGGGGAIEIQVTSKAKTEPRFLETQDVYDPARLYATESFKNNLTADQQSVLQKLYDGCNPRPTIDLLNSAGSDLIIGSTTFKCTPEQLFSGLIEIMYTMRNALLHGEVEPDEKTLACYEPAYRILMQFLNAMK